MSFPNKEDRKKCWDSRDRYWQCLDGNKDEQELCQKQRKAYESSCPMQWVQHFDRKRNYLKFKDRIEKGGYDPLDDKVPPSASTAPVQVQTERRQRIYKHLLIQC